jgi:predicted AlkP superfamily phosphohydrolase/phosphomutase
MRRAVTALVASALGVTLACALLPSGSKKPARKVIVLGMDGLDPELLQKYMGEGKLPNFSALASRGSLVRLGTSIPPQSPVAWSNLITGMEPGGHGIFDFIHRDPGTMLPYLSTSKVEPPTGTLKLGSWVFPLWGGGVTLLRHGKAFWQVLDQHGVPATVIRMPANFPPAETKSRSLAGMGTPDLLGTYGTFSFYTDNPLLRPGPANGGRVYAVEVENDRVRAKLYGPGNPFRKDEAPAAIDFTVWLDPEEPVAKIVLPDQEILLQEGEWSGWVHVQFDLIPHWKSVSAICRFYLKEAHPGFELYVSPFNLDPADPALPISTPADLAIEMAEELGPYHTLGIAEDTKALSAGVLNDGEFLAQVKTVMDEQVKAFSLELQRFRRGLLFFYFSSVDQTSHMLWRMIDERHPAYNAALAEKYGRALEQVYQEMDRVVGMTLAKMDGDTTLIVLSDHGFAPYYRSFNLNTWLLEQGYIVLKNPMSREGELFSNVDWSRTRAYGLGLNGLYLNLAGRERNGIVPRGPEADGLLKEIREKLLGVQDAKTGLPVITQIVDSAQAYPGPYQSESPDLVIGYNRGYRAGWSTVLGGFSSTVLEDNTEPWSGDHCMDSRLVPGVLLSNRKVSASSPSLKDVAPTILGEFGIRKTEAMTGQPVF